MHIGGIKKYLEECLGLRYPKRNTLHRRERGERRENKENLRALCVLCGKFVLSITVVKIPITDKNARVVKFRAGGYKPTNIFASFAQNCS
jgi:hypothetical protein